MTRVAIVGAGALAAILAAILATGGSAMAKRDRDVAGDTLRAARLLGSSRTEEARAVLLELEKRAATVPEVKWLKAELAFVDGRYDEAITSLEGLPDNAVGGQVGLTRRLATQTRAVTSSFTRSRSPAGRFEIWAGPRDAPIVDVAGAALDAAYEALAADLGHRPPVPIRVELLGSPSDLAQLSTLTEEEIATTGTIALSKYGKLMVVSPRATVFGYPWLDTLAHEFVHLVVAQLSHDQVPVWLHEGLARFQQARWRRAPGNVLTPNEKALVRDALRRGRWIGLDEMHPSMAKLPSQDAAQLAYAEVVTLVDLIYTKVGYPGLRTLILHQRDGKSAKRAITEVMGVPFATLERNWKEALKRADLSGARAGSGRVRLRRGGAADGGAGVERIANAKQRRLARLGGMLRARGHLPAAVVEYEKALALGDDPFISGRLAHTLVELGRHERAAELAAPLVVADENDAAAAVALGVSMNALGRWAEGATALEIALRISPFDPEVRCGLHKAYAAVQDKRAAREDQACRAVSGGGDAAGADTP